MKLVLKFFLKEGNCTRLVMSPAVINDWNQYQDATHIYTEEGAYEKKHISGLMEIWKDDN